MKRLLLLVIAPCLSFTTMAQDKEKSLKVAPKEHLRIEKDGWNQDGFFLLNVNQMAQTEWISGGEGFQIGINFIINKAVHHRKGKFSFDSYLDMELGLVEAESYHKFRKTNDRFDLSFELQHNIKNSQHFKYAAISNIRTQLFDGHSYKIVGDPKISGFFSPGKIMLAFGIDYTNKNDEKFFSIFGSPFAMRLVTKLDKDFYDQQKFGVDSLHKVYEEIGANVTIHFFKKISKTTSFVNHTDLYSNYLRTPENIDVLINNVLLVDINKKFVFSLILDIAYDHYTKHKLQVYETLGIGLKFKI